MPHYSNHSPACKKAAQASNLHEAMFVLLIIFIIMACNKDKNSATRQPGKSETSISFPLSTDLSIELIDIPVSSDPFMMGWKGEGESESTPAQPVLLTSSYYMAKFETTQAQWLTVTKADNPSSFSVKGGRSHTDDLTRPVEGISWNQVQEFIKKVNALPGRPEGMLFRLPTEAEWEYACRSGSNGIYRFGGDRTRLKEYAWYRDNSGSTTHGTNDLKSPNAFGLYNMHGNVCEFVQDWWAPYTESSDPIKDPFMISGKGPIVRGGGWGNLTGSCTSSMRAFTNPENPGFDTLVGFRVVLAAPLK